MTIKISTDCILVDGVRYIKATETSEMWGMKEIASYLGHLHSDGTPNVNNLYHNCINENIKFPNFDKKLAYGGRKPWTKKEVIDWLSIPILERKSMYKEQHAEA